MMETEYYSFLLDFFPLTDAVMRRNKVLGDSLQQAAIEALVALNAQVPCYQVLERLRILLSLANDLGYVENDVIIFLDKQLRFIMNMRYQ